MAQSKFTCTNCGPAYYDLCSKLSDAGDTMVYGRKCRCCYGEFYRKPRKVSAKRLRECEEVREMLRQFMEAAV